jgi:hypothetical protein
MCSDPVILPSSHYLLSLQIPHFDIRIIMVARTITIVAAACVLMAGCGSAPAQLRGDVSSAGDLGGKTGGRVVIVGAVSVTPWQHMIDPRPSHPHETYFDMGSGQIVVYSKDPIECGGIVRIVGTVIKIEGSSKDPRRKETCTEYQVQADSWECLR